MTCSICRRIVAAGSRAARLCRLAAALIVCCAGSVALADVPGAMSAITAGDCKTAGEAINAGLQRDDGQAYFLAGFLYDRTGCVPSDPARAIRLYRRASFLGDQDAPVYLGLLYGLGRGVPRDYTRAHRAFNSDDGEVAVPSTNEIVDLMLGYAETVAHVAERQVGYPTTANVLGVEATLDAVLDSDGDPVRFDRVNVGVEVGSNLPRTRTFTDPLEEAYRTALVTVPRPDVDFRHRTQFATTWQFRMRRGPSNEKVRLEGYVTVGPARVVH